MIPLWNWAPRDLRGVFALREEPRTLLEILRFRDRPFPFDPVDEHGGKDAVPLVIEHLRSVGIEEQGLAAVREDITAPAGDRIAEGGAASSA